DFFAVEKPHLHQPLHKQIFTGNRFDASSLAHVQAIQRSHGGSPDDGTHQNLRRAIAAYAEPCITDLQEAGGTRLEGAQTTADAQAKFCESVNPVRLTTDIGDVGPFTRAEVFQRQESFSHEKDPLCVLRFSLNSISIQSLYRLSSGRGRRETKGRQVTG